MSSSQLSSTMTFTIALIVVVGSFAYFIIRGGGDAVIVPIMAASLGMVLSYFFAHQISNGAATSAVASAFNSAAAAQTAADHATNAAQSAAEAAANRATASAAAQAAAQTPEVKP